MKQRIKITTVDPPTRRVEGVLKDGAVIQVAIYEVPTNFRWPVVGEYWTVTREGNFWYLGSAHELDSDFPIENLQPGETKIGASAIYDGSGSRILSGVEINTFGKTSAQIDAAYPSKPENGCFISDPVNHWLLVRQNGKWYKTAVLTLIS